MSLLCFNVVSPSLSPVTSFHSHQPPAHRCPCPFSIPSTSLPHSFSRRRPSSRHRITSSASVPVKTVSLPPTTRIVIAGAGPAGLYAAASLHQLNFTNITVIERLPHTPKVDIARSYVFALSLRGRRALERLPPPLLTMLEQGSAVPSGYTFCTIPVQGKAMAAPPSRIFGEKFIPGMLFYRATFVKILRQYVEQLCGDNVKIIYNANVSRISTFEHGDDGECSLRVHYDKNGDSSDDDDDDDEQKEKYVGADLLVACDGVNSRVVQSLQKHGNQLNIESKRGFNKRIFEHPTDGRILRALILDENSLNDIPGVPDNVASTHWTNIIGHSITMSVLPMLPEDRDTLGGLLALISLHHTHELWTLSTPEQLYKFLESNFPQLNFRSCLTKTAAQAFLSGNYTTFPPIARLESLVGTYKNKCGIVICGDGSKSMPPDLGQGLNSSLEDVSTFIDVLMSQKSSIVDIVNEYEKKRMPDIQALMELLTFAGNFQGANEPRWNKRRRAMDRWCRDNGTTLFPWLIDPSPGVLMGKGLPYTVVRRKQRKTTAVLLLLGLAVVFTGMMGVANIAFIAKSLASLD